MRFGPWVVAVVAVLVMCGACGGGSDDHTKLQAETDSAVEPGRAEPSAETRPSRGDLPNTGADLGDVVTGAGVELRTVHATSVRSNDVNSYLDLVVEARVADGNGPTQATGVSVACGADGEQPASYRTDGFDGEEDLPLLGLDENPITETPRRWRLPGYIFPLPLPDECRDGQTWVLVELAVSADVANSDLGDGRIEPETGDYRLPVAVDFDRLAEDASPWPEDQPRLGPVCDAVAAAPAVTEVEADRTPWEPCTFRRGGERYVDVDLVTDPTMLASARPRATYVQIDGVTFPVAEFLSGDAPSEVEPSRSFLIDVSDDAALLFDFAAGVDGAFPDPSEFLATLNLEALLTPPG